MLELAAVALGGAVGASARYGLTQGLSAWLGQAAPYGTFSANVLGSLLLGWLATREWGAWAGVESRLLLGVGVLGGFTTYSSFNQETLRLCADGNYGRAMLYVTATLVTCLIAGLSGALLGRAFR